MDRPLTVSGLLDKRAELIKLRDQLQGELEAVSFDLDHLDATIRLFDPEQVSPVRRRYTAQHAARGGEMARFVLATPYGRRTGRSRRARSVCAGPQRTVWMRRT